MKHWLIGLSALTLVGTVSVLNNESVRAEIQAVGETIVETIRRPEVKLTLGLEKKVVIVDEKGQEKVTWETLAGQVQVQPGDVLRYTVDGANAGDLEAKNLVITQPVPEQMLYTLDSATTSKAAAITYSIDGGQSFVAEPMVEVVLPDGSVKQEPAPAEAYTHVRWSFGEDLASATLVNVSYEVTVK